MAASFYKVDIPDDRNADDVFRAAYRTMLLTRNALEAQGAKLEYLGHRIMTPQAPAPVPVRRPARVKRRTVNKVMSLAQRLYWASMTPAQRKREARRRLGCAN